MGQSVARRDWLLPQPAPVMDGAMPRIRRRTDCNQEGKEQVRVNMSNTDSIQSNTVEWNTINWRKVEKAVFKHGAYAQIVVAARKCRSSSKRRLAIITSRTTGTHRVRKANFPSQQK